MGIIYKLMKHQRRLEMLNPNVADSNETDIVLETNVQDKRIKAEQILEFCKILVETSNSAKSVKRKRQQKQTLTLKNHHDHSVFEQISNGSRGLQVQTMPEMMVEGVEPEITINNFKTKDSSPKKERKRHPINNSPSPSSISLEEPEKEVEIITSVQTAHSSHCTTLSPANTFTCYPLQNRQYQNQRSCKKDILQKIRNQILERKRQRQLASVQPLNGVWRPW